MSICQLPPELQESKTQNAKRIKTERQVIKVPHWEALVLENPTTCAEQKRKTHLANYKI
jgi:hypothetical protein